MDPTAGPTPAMEPMPDEEAKAALAETPGWSRGGIHITRRVQTEDFAAALELVNGIGRLAEEQNHHPDVCIKNYDQVHLSVTTHDAGGLTDRDFKLARAINELVE